MPDRIPLKWLSLTDFKCSIYRGVKAKALKAALEKDGTMKSFETSGWGKRLAAKAKKAALTDFERFRVMVAKKTRAKLIAKKKSAPVGTESCTSSPLAIERIGLPSSYQLSKSTSKWLES